MKGHYFARRFAPRQFRRHSRSHHANAAERLISPLRHDGYSHTGMPCAELARRGRKIATIFLAHFPQLQISASSCEHFRIDIGAMICHEACKHIGPVYCSSPLTSGVKEIGVSRQLQLQDRRRGACRRIRAGRPRARARRERLGRNAAAPSFATTTRYVSLILAEQSSRGI